MKNDWEFHDDFSDDREAGTVNGTLSTSGHKRLGVDKEGVLSIDNGALRIAPLIEAGFDRAVLSYGPFPRQAGLACAVWILNGHNTSQSESLEETFSERIKFWLKGNEIDPPWERLARWLRSRRVRRTFRQFRRWRRIAVDSDPLLPLNENLAVGWFPSPLVKDPRREGHAFVMHALGPENGELWIGGNGNRTRSLRGVQNVPLYYAAVIRSGGVVYYVSSLEGALGMAPHPLYRPVALELGPLPEELYLGIQQSVLGQIGWRLDTRIQGVRVSTLEGYESWCGGAHAADRITGDGISGGSLAEVGGMWRVFGGKKQHVGCRQTGSSKNTNAVLDPSSPSGLIHAAASLGKEDQNRVGLLWRVVDERNHWRMEVARRECEIILVEEGERRILVSTKFPDSLRHQAYRLQVLDDGRHMMAYVDGEPVSDSYITDARLAGATGVGFLLDGPGQGEQTISSFEAHPRFVEMPKALFMGTPWFRKGTRVVLADDFAGQAGDIEGRTTPVGGLRWKRLIGNGVIELTGNGAARVRGSVKEPCPGRTAYCLEWANPEFADLEVTITPPGIARGQKHHCTAGFIFYQDQDNYVTLNVWRGDSYGGGSISTFFTFGGFEDIYDAVWTNVGDRVFYGRPSRIRVCCDGERYLVFVDDEPVLFRAFRDVYPDVGRLLIRKIGILANWEFGTDTGSKFAGFSARI